MAALPPFGGTRMYEIPMCPVDTGVSGLEAV